jgi:hypothetical protein
MDTLPVLTAETAIVLAIVGMATLLFATEPVRVKAAAVRAIAAAPVDPPRPGPGSRSR